MPSFVLGKVIFLQPAPQELHCLFRDVVIPHNRSDRILSPLLQIADQLGIMSRNIIDSLVGQKLFPVRFLPTQGRGLECE